MPYFDEYSIVIAFNGVLEGKYQIASFLHLFVYSVNADRMPSLIGLDSDITDDDKMRPLIGWDRDVTARSDTILFVYT